MTEFGLGVLIFLQLLTWLAVSGHDKTLRKIPRLIKLRGWDYIGRFVRWRERNGTDI